jgi:hypothetical protein
MRVGRNDPWPCGSGKKYKKCCMARDRAAPQSPLAQTAAAPAAALRHATSTMPPLTPAAPSTQRHLISTR